MKESEITVQIFNSFDEVDNILKNQGYKMIENYQLNDWYFSKFSDVKDIEYIKLLNNSFLVRQVIGSEEEVKLLYKKKEVDEFNNVISEEKIKTKIDSLNNSIDIFKRAGLNNYCIVKNNTYIYKKDAICFAVQLIENLGIFIEYEEDDTMLNLSEKEKFNKMINVVNSLGLKLGDDYFCKKVYMLLKKQVD